MMETFPPKFSKVLVTPDPHYIPGYAGYCPQFKYHLGKTYGQLTSRLLTSPDISRSQRLVLNSGRLTPTKTDTGTRDEIWRTGSGHSSQPMIPGYTGFVPRRQNYFSKTYAETCRDALSEFDSNQKRIRLTSVDSLAAVHHSLPDIKSLSLSAPLTPVLKEAAPFKSVNSWKPLGSPYLMDDSNPHKYFISGFSGYVPKSRVLFGTSYPITTNKALIHFGKEMKQGGTALSVREESDDSLPPVPTIYPSHQGLLPKYTGHVPGYRFRYGQTFGQLTSNTLALSGTDQELKCQR
ncbi:ciliary microtubule inner protein 2B [Trichomycterus rosablanca]|uniref:ciliary microtubule inner protein 2B n=1 Tax=Trichomycterus rosablanca TaxID=2290929 RepID=UPI002F3533F1